MSVGVCREWVPGPSLIPASLTGKGGAQCSRLSVAVVGGVCTSDTWGHTGPAVRWWKRTHVLVDRTGPATLLRDTCPLGLGGPLAGHPVRRAPGLAQGQRLPAARTPAPDAFFPGLLQEHFQDTHGDRQHLDPSLRCVLPAAAWAGTHSAGFPRLFGGRDRSSHRVRGLPICCLNS